MAELQDLPDRGPHNPTAASRVPGAYQVALAAGDIERSLVVVAEGAVGGAVDADGHGVGFQNPAGRCPDVNHGAGAAYPVTGGADNVAFGVEAHAVDATLVTSVVGWELVQDDVLAQRAVILYRVGT